MVASFASTLEDAECRQLARETIISLLLSADVMVAVVVLRVTDDLGAVSQPADGSADVDG